MCVCVCVRAQASRFYRAPEVVLGLPRGPPIDVWGAACTLFEAYVGSPLFGGGNNHDLLLTMAEVCVALRCVLH